MKQQWHSGFDDSSGWGRLIDPVCLFILCQIAGTLWVIIPRKSFAPPVAPNPIVAAVKAETPGLINQRDALEKAIRSAREQVNTLALPAHPAVIEKDRVAAQARAEEQRVKDLESKLAVLAKMQAEISGKVAATAPPSPRLDQQADQLGQLLVSRQVEVKQLQLALEQTKGSGTGSGFGSPRMVETDLAARRVHLIGNRALPLDARHYKVEEGRLRTTNQDVVRYTKTAAGETMDDLRKPGSDIATFLGQIDPAKQFLLCLVTSDSLPIFREVRNLARARGIKVAWDTNYDADGILVFTAGKGHNRIPDLPN